MDLFFRSCVSVVGTHEAKVSEKSTRDKEQMVIHQARRRGGGGKEHNNNLHYLAFLLPHIKREKEATGKESFKVLLLLVASRS